MALTIYNKIVISDLLNRLIMFTLLDSFTILMSSMILISPIMVLIYMMKNIISRYYDELITNVNGILTFIKLILINKYILTVVPKLFSIERCNDREFRKQMSEDKIKKEIQKLYNSFDEDEIKYDKKIISRMNSDELFSHLLELKHTKEVIFGKNVITEIITQSAAYMRNYINGKNIMGEKINIDGLEGILSEKIKDMDSIITDISEMFTEKNMNPIGKLLFDISKTVILKHFCNKLTP